MLGVMKCPTNLENYCASGSGTRNSFLSSAGNHPLRCSARSRASLLRGSRLCAFQSISRLTPCDALRGCTSLLRLGSVTKACPFRTPFDHPSTLRASTSASAPGSGAQALSYWLRPRAGYRRLRRPSTRLRASGGVMLSLRRQVSPGLCHRATPSSPEHSRRLVVDLRCARGHRAPDLTSEWPLPGLAQRLSCMLGMCWLGPGSRLGRAAAAASWRTQAARYSSLRPTAALLLLRSGVCCSARQGH